MNGHHVISTCLLCAASLATSDPVRSGEASPHTPLRVAEFSTLFEDLSPKFNKLTTGMSMEDAVATMGKPNEVSTHEAFGVAIQTLTWRSTLYGHTFVARFVLARLASKSLST